VNEVYYYDTVSYKNGNPKLQVNSEEFWANIQKMFAELSPETDEFCQFMLQNKLLDTELRKGKSSISYMTFLHKYGQPFILANFEGTWKDCSLTIHEMGHAFQYYQTHKEGIRQIEYVSAGNAIAETHAMGMELLNWDSYSLFFKEGTSKFQFYRINQFLGTIVYCCMSEDFQQFIYRTPQASPTEHNQKWLELQKVYYPYQTDAYYEDNAYLKAGHEWQENPQIFCYPFYAVEYSLATLCAFQFWMKSERNKEETWEDYLRLCKVGGKYSYFDSLQLANLRSPFDETVIKEIAEFLGDWLEKVDDSGF